MKKISYLIILLILCFLTSCKKTNIKKFDIETQTDFLESFYQTINTEKITYIACEFRSKDDYENGHIKQFQNYDLEKGSYEEFENWITSSYSSKAYVYLINPNENIITIIEKKFKNCYIYLGEYEELEDLDKLFIIDKGPYDCGC